VVEPTYVPAEDDNPRPSRLRTWLTARRNRHCGVTGPAGLSCLRRPHRTGMHRAAGVDWGRA